MPINVRPLQDAPKPFEWAGVVSDSIFVNSDNISSSYTFNWTESKDVDNEIITYLLYAKPGPGAFEIIQDSTATTLPISYLDFAEDAFENYPMLANVLVEFTVRATDGIDTVNIDGDNRLLFIDRYEYLSTLNTSVPTEFALHDNYPNPFNPTTKIRFDLPESRDVNMIIYNMLGQKINEFKMYGLDAGYHSLSWNATNSFGDPLGAGVYFYQLQTKDFVKTKKMILLK